MQVLRRNHDAGGALPLDNAPWAGDVFALFGGGRYVVGGKAMRSRGIVLAIACLASIPLASGALGLERRLPRGQTVCYGGPASAYLNTAIALVRITRPERLHAYDSPETRMARIVINFASKLRLEDTATCREQNGAIVCNSTTCDGAFFTLLSERGGGTSLRFETEIPRALWSCSDDTLRALMLRDSDRLVAMQRGAGSCIPARWDQTD